MMSAMLVTSVLDHIEFSTVIAVIVIVLCALISYKVSVRRPLYYNLFVVEMHTWTARRMVQVLHLGQEFHPPVTWDRLVQRMRARAPRVQGDQRVAISDTNIVIQSPNTVIDSPAPARTPEVDLITLWDIEMPPPLPGHVPDATRDSQYAAAAAIAILARGFSDDASLLSRVFQNSENRPSEEDSGVIPNINRIRNVNPPLSDSHANHQHDYVTTDVTYTTPSASLDLHHQISTRMSDVTQTHSPRNETITVDAGEDEDDDGEDTEYENEDEDEDEELGSEEATEASVGVYPEVAHPDKESTIESMETMAELSQEGPSEEKVLIRLKFMNDTERDTYASLSDTVSTFKRNNFTDLKTKIIRLIFQGQLLRDDFRTLEYYGLQPGSVVHCHISNVPYTGVRQNEYEEAERVPTRRRSQRVEVQDETNENVAEEPADPPPQFADLLTDEATRRRTAQDRNVGQIYFLLSTMLPILSGIGLAFFRPDRLRDLFRPTTLLTISHWLCNLLVDSGFLDLGEEEDNESSLQTSTIFLIFGGQMFAAGVFFYYFPQTFDRFGYYVLSVMMLYFIFVVYSRQRRRQPDVDAQNELIENQIVQERISLL